MRHPANTTVRRAGRARSALRTSLGLALVLGACVAPPDREKGTGEQREAESEPVAPSDEGERVASADANGWGDDIAWRGLDEGLDEAKKLGRPVMMIVHTSWCGNCKKLKPTFAETELEELSERFVMINLDQDVEPRAQSYGPDGNYIPRVVFLDAKGEVDDSLLNGKRTRTRYFYTPHDDLIGTMRRALERHGSHG